MPKMVQVWAGRFKGSSLPSLIGPGEIPLRFSESATSPKGGRPVSFCGYSLPALFLVGLFRHVKFFGYVRREDDLAC
jgi:hypothetical protein